jgi:hypothetical protein
VDPVAFFSVWWSLLILILLLRISSSIFFSICWFCSVRGWGSFLRLFLLLRVRGIRCRRQTSVSVLDYWGLGSPWMIFEGLPLLAAVLWRSSCLP